MSNVTTIQFLPEFFRSETNQRFLGATLDQLVADAVNAPVNGYIGRTFAPTYKQTDNYVPEITTSRQNYQLEAGVVVKDQQGQVSFNTGYVDLLHAIDSQGGLSSNHQRLFTSESYDYDGHFDYDKFVNYYNYYWLSQGPAAVPVYGSGAPLQANFQVTRNLSNDGYTFSGLGFYPNTQLTLVRGGTYTFEINQPGNAFWIQTQPGTSGLDNNIPTVSTREVHGVINNGTDQGLITFQVPQKSGQNFFVKMPLAASVDLATDLNYVSVQNQLLSTFLKNYPSGLDGIISQLQGKSLIFINADQDDTYWTTGGNYDYLGFANDSFDPGQVVPASQRRNVWKINLAPVNSGDYLIQLTPVTNVTPQNKIFVKSGLTNAAKQFWLNDNLLYQQVPVITAVADYLYYQDGTNPGFTGTIKLIDNVATDVNVTQDILGKRSYVSPNGVVFTNGLKIQFDSGVVPASYANGIYYVEGVGTAISLTPEQNLQVTESYGTYIDHAPDYITINRSSPDHNAWSRYNRWFHRDVLIQTAKYLNSDVDYGLNLAARRPIIEFDAGLKLYNTGTHAASVDIIVLEPTDAFRNIEGQSTAVLDGAVLENGQTILFTQDYDDRVTNRVWRVQKQIILSTNYITLVDTGVVADIDVNVQVKSGNHQGQTYWFNGQIWQRSQIKTTTNQPPFFDLADASGVSFSDTNMYPDSDFTGCKLFGYKPGTGSADPILGFSLTHENFNNVGDIVFDNYYDIDSFTYAENQQNVTVKLNSGYIMVYHDGHIQLRNNWTTSNTPTRQFQIFTKFFDGSTLNIGGKNLAFVQIDIAPDAQTSTPTIKVYVNNRLLEVSEYQITTYGIYGVVVLNFMPVQSDKIDVLLFSENSVSGLGHYIVPDNLNYNPLNQNFSTVINGRVSTITLGQIRSHYQQLQSNYAGDAPVQDVNIRAQGGIIRQHSAPVIYAATFLNDPLLNYISSLDLARREYARFKNRFLSQCLTLSALDFTDPVSGVDMIMQNLSLSKNSSFAWYYSDMIPHGSNHVSTTYTVLNVLQSAYEITSIFHDTQPSGRAVLVYVNGHQQIRGVDYKFSTLSPTVVFLRTLAFGDVIEIRDYTNTNGCYVPETPAKLGLAPSQAPEIFLDDTYQRPITVIRGHDGSLTPAFGDFRDEFLLELECRIYNNIKVNYADNVLNIWDVVPGRFRKTDYSQSEITHLLTKNFLSWAGANNVEYAQNVWYDTNDSWTWNYAGLPDVIDGTRLTGSWRAVFQYYYDTDHPHQAPWEMLGLNSEPTWWADRYGSAPYTRGNGPMWTDLEAGLIWNAGDPYTDHRFARPGLSKIIPVDERGNLLSPRDIPLTATYNSSSRGNPFQVGQQSPAETAWRRSSDYAYAVQQMLALAKPAEYFATQIDVSAFGRNPVTKQISRADNSRISPGNFVIPGPDPVTGAINRTSGYLNWIADYIRNLGMEPVSKITDYFNNFSVQLSYKVGGFTDKNLIEIQAEQTTPGSTNASVILPQENYQIYLHKSEPVATAVYSAVIVEIRETGYAVSGYDLQNPFFTVNPSIANQNFGLITANEQTVKVYQDGAANNVLIPYGTVFGSVQQLTDFLISYSRFLTGIGFVFNSMNADLQQVSDWNLSIQEFLYWSQQGWGPGNVLILNPANQRLKLNSLFCVVDEIVNAPQGSRVLDQNFKPIPGNSFNVLRTESAQYGNTFIMDVLNSDLICYAKLHLVQYEHVLVFDNVSDFGDIVYVPESGTRQNRLKLTGYKTGAWSGALSAAGYVYVSPKSAAWASNQDYRAGDIISFNNSYYMANTNIPAADQFSPAGWVQIPLSDLQTRLLPSLAHNAQKFQNFYDVDQPPAEENLQLASAGLIGFRPRSYLSDLGISIPVQTKFYQGFIKQKGTQQAITALTNSNFNNVQGNITLYEEWAFKAGTYGDVQHNQYQEYVLDQSVFVNNPVSLTFGTDDVTGTGIIAVNSANVYAASNLTSLRSDIYDNRSTTQYQTDLPWAGYVNTADIDLEIFNFARADYQQLSSAGTGYKIWTAQDASGTWNVFRTSQANFVATALTYNLDNYAVLTFDNSHDFVVGDFLLMNNFVTIYENFNGLYEIQAVPDNLSVTIVIKDAAALQYLRKASPLNNRTGTIYTLDSMHVNNIALLDQIKPRSGWLAGDRVWVDNATAAGWGVYEYNPVWGDTLSAITGNVTNYASGVAALNNGIIALTNVPNYAIDLYANVHGSYVNVQTISSTDINFGSVMVSQGNTLVVGSDASANVRIYDCTIPGYANLQYSLTLANLTGISAVALSSDLSSLFFANAQVNQVEALTLNSGAYAWYQTITGNTASGFGTSLSVSPNAHQLLVGAPGDQVSGINAGTVALYELQNTAYELYQTITANVTNQTAGFGSSMTLTPSGNLFVGVPGSTAAGYLAGVVERYQWTGNSFIHTQTLHNPETSGAFGSVVAGSEDDELLVVGSAGAESLEQTYFDEHQTIIDGGSMKFTDTVRNSGAAYVFELIKDLSTISDAGKYYYVQDLEAQVLPRDQYGSGLAVTRDRIVIATPGARRAWVFDNAHKSTVWTLKRQVEPRVDLDSINRTFIYDRSTHNILAALDYVDPIKGKVLNSVGRDIDYYRATDPAAYNAGTGPKNSGFHWGSVQTGKIWWDVSQVRYVDYEQGTLSYRLSHWGRTMAGSVIAVYQWTGSDVLPSQYVKSGYSGTPLHADDSAYCAEGYVDQTGRINVRYYFWVTGSDHVAEQLGKNNSTISITAAIEDPQSQGIPYAVVLRSDSLAMYNVDQLLTGRNSILHLGSRSANAGLIHTEYTLVQEGNPDSKIPENLLSKLIDSLSGQDAAEQPVPDPVLSPAQAYGIDIRPRQSMFINQDLAWTNYRDYVNTVLMGYEIVQRRIFTLLDSQEPIPNAEAGGYVLTVSSDSELPYVDVEKLTGNRVLVVADSTQQGRWTIREYVNGAFSQTPVRIQSFKTPLYWHYVDWYDDNFDPSTTVNLAVPDLLTLGQQTLVANTYVRVQDAGTGNFVIYHIDASLNKNLVAIQNGTIQIGTEYIPPLEKRQILSALHTELLIDDLAGEFNQGFFYLIKFALTEQKNPDWVFKTSFVSATQRIRKLQQFPAYIPDNQNFYLDYVQEVKPYRTMLREFIVDYQGLDNYGADVTDFDIQPFWDSNTRAYRSPSGEQPYDQILLSKPNGVWGQWYVNHTYEICGITIYNSGSGFTSPPQVIIRGSGGSGATAVAVLNSQGGIAKINVTNPGSGYVTEPEILINGTGSGVIAQAILRNVYTGNNTGHNVIRSALIHMVYDRVESGLGFDTQVFDATGYDVDLADGFQYPGVVIDGSGYNPETLDSIIQSHYTDDLGTAGQDVVIDGGAYYDTFSSYAPPELIPGRMFDSLDIQVFNANVSDPTDVLGFRIFSDLSGNCSFYRISAAATTTLSSDLYLSDRAIQVTDPQVLSAGNPAAAIPGAVFINGEKITYYRNFARKQPVPWRANLDIPQYSVISYQSNTYTTLGNVYAQHFANISANVELVTNSNVLTQIRRAVDGTAPQYIHPAGTLVVDAGVRESIPQTQTGNIVLASDTTYISTANVSYVLTLTNPITANIGDYLAQVNPAVIDYAVEGYDTLGLDIQKFDETIPPNSLEAHMRVLESVINSQKVVVTLVSGTIQGLPEVFDSALGFDVEGFDNTGYPLFVNGFNSGSDIRAVAILGQVNNLGQVTVTANTRLTTGNIWYNPGIGIVPVLGFTTSYPASIADLVYELTTTLSVTVNIGDTITFIDPKSGLNNPITTLNVVASVSKSLTVPVIISAGTAQTMIETFDTGLGFDYAGFDNINPPYYIYVNGSVTNVNVVSFKPIGTLSQTQGPVYATDGRGLFSSTTVQANFLKASPAYVP
jgi:hypothetical protein